MGIFVISSISVTKIFKNRLLVFLNFTIIIISILFLIFYALNLNFRDADIVQVLIPFLCVLSFYCSHFLRKDINILTIYFIILSLIVGGISAGTYSSLRTYGEWSYLLEGKNQIGAILALSTSLSYFIIPYQKGRIKYCMWFCFLLGVVLSYIIGCRSAFLATLILVAFFSYKRYRHRWGNLVLIALFLFPIIFVFLGDNILLIFSDFFIGDKNTASLDDISSGRMERNISAIKYIYANFFVGELQQQSNIPLIHNYLLLKFVRYGVFAFPFMFYYLSYAFFAVKGFKRMKQGSFDCIGFCILIIPYVVSLLEPGAPFGPGTIYMFPYLLYGFSLKKINNI